MFQAKRPGCRASLSLAVDFLLVMYIKDKQNFIFDCGQAWVPQYVLWPSLGFRELKWTEKYGSTLSFFSFLPTVVHCPVMLHLHISSCSYHAFRGA